MLDDLCDGLSVGTFCNDSTVFIGITLMSIKIQPDATVCRYLFTAKSLYMFRVSQHHVGGK